MWQEVIGWEGGQSRGTESRESARIGKVRQRWHKDIPRGKGTGLGTISLQEQQKQCQMSVSKVLIVCFYIRNIQVKLNRSSSRNQNYLEKKRNL